MAGSQGRLWLNTAKGIQSDIHGAGLGRPIAEPVAQSPTERTPLDQFDELVTNQPLRVVTRELFANRHYSQAVLDAFKFVNNAVKDKSGVNDRDGADLMRYVFSEKNPVLRLTPMKSRSQKDEHNGYRDIFAGAMIGIRNPRSRTQHRR